MSKGTAVYLALMAGYLVGFIAGGVAADYELTAKLNELYRRTQKEVK